MQHPPSHSYGSGTRPAAAVPRPYLVGVAFVHGFEHVALLLARKKLLQPVPLQNAAELFEIQPPVLW